MSPAVRAHLVGAAYRGSKKGMTDGTILIGGDAGSEVGAAMRRGTLAVGGSCGDAAGFGMIAGSILVFGSCGIRAGAGMKRGTIGLFGPRSDQAAAHLPTSRPLPAALSSPPFSRADSPRVPRRPGAARDTNCCSTMAIWSPWARARSG